MKLYPHPGKFENEPAILPYLYDYVQHGADDEIGSCDDVGWVAWRLNGVDEADFCHLAGFVAEKCGMSIAELSEAIAEIAGVPIVIVEDSDGFVTMRYGTTAELMWKYRVETANEFYESIER